MSSKRILKASFENGVNQEQSGKEFAWFNIFARSLNDKHQKEKR
jgi:hypothetical protein